jgi:hypothetical protein
MKKFTTFLASLMLVLVVISTITLSLLVIWGGIDPVLSDRIEDTIWLGADVMVASFIVNCALE